MIQGCPDGRNNRGPSIPTTIPSTLLQLPNSPYPRHGTFGFPFFPSVPDEIDEDDLEAELAGLDDELEVRDGARRFSIRALVSEKQASVGSDLFGTSSY